MWLDEKGSGKLWKTHGSVRDWGWEWGELMETWALGQLSLSFTRAGLITPCAFHWCHLSNLRIKVVKWGYSAGTIIHLPLLIEEGGGISFLHILYTDFVLSCNPPHTGIEHNLHPFPTKPFAALGVSLLGVLSGVCFGDFLFREFTDFQKQIPWFWPRIP